MRKGKIFMILIISVLAMTAFLYGCGRPSVDETAYSIQLSEESITVAPGQQTQLFATITPDDGKQSIRWVSSNERYVQVDGNGNVLGVAPGNAVIIATLESDDSVSVTCSITVKQAVTGIEIEDDDTPLELIKGGDDGRLTVNVLPSNAGNKNYDFSVNPTGVVSVESNGTVKALAGGTAVVTVTAREGGFTAQRTVNVTAAAEDISISIDALMLEKGEKETVTANVLPVDATNKTVVFSSLNPLIAAVDPETGEVTGVENGETVITATSDDGGFEASVNVTVYTAAESIALNKTAIAATIDKDGNTVSTELEVTFTDGAAPHTEKVLLWESSDSLIAVAAKDGENTAVVTPKGKGTAVITVITESGKAAECTVTVEVKVSEITLNKERIDLFIGGSGNTDTLQVVSVAPSGTYGASNAGYKMELANPAESEFVDFNAETGVVKAVKNNVDGIRILVTALDGGGAQAECYVYVKTPATGIVAANVIDDTVNLTIGADGSKDSFTVAVIIQPEGEASSLILWEADDLNVASVADGLITAEGNGTTVIKAILDENPDIVLEITVNVTVFVSSVTITNGTTIYAIMEDDEETTEVQLYAEVSPYGLYGATNPAVVWGSNNPDIATVNPDTGLVTLKNGTAVIVASAVDAGGAYAEITIHTAKRPAGVEIWANIDENGLSNTESAVNQILDGGIIPRLAVNGDANLKTLQLSAKVLPYPEADPSVEWFSYDEAFLTVDENGLVTAQSVGEAVIGVRTKDGMNEATVEIEIYALAERAVIFNNGIDVTNKEITVSGGNTFALNLELMPVGGEYTNIEYSVSNGALAWLKNQNGNTVWTFETALISEAVDFESIEVVFEIFTAQFPDGFLYTVDVVIVAGVTAVEMYDAPGYPAPVSTKTILRNQTVQLYAKVFPENAYEKSLTWTTSDVSVLTVSQTGLIKGVGNGTAIVRATSKNNKSANGSILVTVYTAAETVEIHYGGQKVTSDEFLLLAYETQFTHRTTPEGAATNAVVWSVSNPLVAAVDQTGKVTAHKMGVASLTVHVKDNPLIRASIPIRVGFDAKEGDIAADIQIMQNNQLSSSNEMQSYIKVTVEDDAINEATGKPYEYQLFYSFDPSCDNKTALIEGAGIGNAHVYNRLFTSGSYYVPLLSPPTRTEGFFVLVEAGVTAANLTDEARSSTFINKAWTAFTAPTTGISTWEQLKTAVRSGGNVTLAGNIDAQGEAFDGTSTLSGIFDGKGFIVFNLNVTKGLYRSVNGGTFKNVIFANPKAAPGETQSGILAGYVDGNGSMTLEKVQMINFTVSSAFEQTGAVVGYIFQAATVNINNCQFSGKLLGGSNSGGLVGQVIQQSVVNITNCEINTQVNVGGSDAGGVIGRGFQDNAGRFNLSNCFIKTTVTATGENAGGVIGQIHNNSLFDMTGCTVIASVDRNAGYRGGIMGRDHNRASATISNCDVEVTFIGGSNAQYGGIVGGYSDFGSDLGIKFVRAYNCRISTNLPDKATANITSGMGYLYVEGGTSVGALADFVNEANNAMYSAVYITVNSGIEASATASASGYQLWLYESGDLTFLGGYGWWFRVSQDEE